MILETGLLVKLAKSGNISAGLNRCSQKKANLSSRLFEIINWDCREFVPACIFFYHLNRLQHKNVPPAEKKNARKSCSECSEWTCSAGEFCLIMGVKEKQKKKLREPNINLFHWLLSAEDVETTTINLRIIFFSFLKYTYMYTRRKTA